MAVPRARRSSLILPVNVPRFVEKAALRGADAIVLDLEDSVPPAEKASARRLVVDALPLAGRGGAEVVVRVNNDPAHLWDDVAAAVHPGLDGLPCPRRSRPSRSGSSCAASRRSERARGLAPGHVRLSLAIETPRGLLRAEAIAASSDRIATMGVGVEDYCLELGVEPSADGIELLYPVARVVTIARPRAFSRRGSWGASRAFATSAPSRGRRRAHASSAARARAASIPIRSPCSTASSHRIPPRSSTRGGSSRRSRKAIARGTASVNLDGKMVDIPVVKRAEVILARARVVAETERRKADALARLR